jgi:hypothetical protein
MTQALRLIMDKFFMGFTVKPQKPQEARPQKRKKKGNPYGE